MCIYMCMCVSVLRVTSIDVLFVCTCVIVCIEIFMFTCGVMCVLHIQARDTGAFPIFHEMPKNYQSDLHKLDLVAAGKYYTRIFPYSQINTHTNAKKNVSMTIHFIRVCLFLHDCWCVCVFEIFIRVCVCVHIQCVHLYL